MINDKEIVNALLNLYKACPSHLSCNNFHHKIQDQHRYGEPCPLEARYEDAMKEANRVLYYKT